MAEKKSILEDAILDIKNIQKALNENTKEILRSVAREEIDGVVKESLLKEDEFEEEDIDADGLDAEPNFGAGDDLDVADDSIEDDGLDGLADASVDVAPEMDSELGMDPLGLDSEVDLTSASDDDVIQIFKKLNMSDEVEIVGDDIHLTVSEPGEYVIKTNNEPATDSFEDEIDSVDSLDGEDDSVEYEIEMDDEMDDAGDFGGSEEEGETVPDDLESVDAEEPEQEGPAEEEEEEVEIDEAIRTNMAAAKKAGAEYQPKVLGAKQIAESRLLVSETKAKYDNLLTEATKLKSENEEFRVALKAFKTQLVETVVLNRNLSYTARLFMENTTTKTEKENIIKRFDEVTDLVEAKKLYKTISNELETRIPIIETVENRMIKGITSGSSAQLTESTAYVDPATKKILDLMNRVNKKQ